jgi:hypothetical protein
MASPSSLDGNVTLPSAPTDSERKATVGEGCGAQRAVQKGKSRWRGDKGARKLLCQSPQTL